MNPNPLTKLQQANEVLEWSIEQKNNIFSLHFGISLNSESGSACEIHQLLFYTRKHAVLKDYFQSKGVLDEEGLDLRNKLIDWTTQYKSMQRKYDKLKERGENPLMHLMPEVSALNKGAESWSKSQRAWDIVELSLLGEANKMPGNLFY